MHLFQKLGLYGLAGVVIVALWWFQGSTQHYSRANKQEGEDTQQSVNLKLATSWNVKQRSISEEEIERRESDTHIDHEVQNTAGRASKTSLTRLGSSLTFDVKTCPKDSLLLTSKLENVEPLHNDCPTLFIVGARKGGTTSLYNYMSHHPDFHGIFLNKRPGIGETFYFARNQHKNMSWKDYVKLFPPRDVAMSGDASVGNLVQCQVPGEIFKACGKQAKIVMLFRDPVARIVSNVLFRHTVGENLSDKIATELQKLSKRSNSIRALSEEDVIARWSSMVCLFGSAKNLVFEGFYYIHLLNWLCNFPSENILIVNSEEFFSEPSLVLDQVVQFVGLRRLSWKDYDKITEGVYNRGNYTQDVEDNKLSDRDKNKLLKVYEPFNKALLRLLDWPNTAVNWEH